MAFGRKSWSAQAAQASEAPRWVRAEPSTPDRALASEMLPDEMLEARTDIGRMLKLIGAAPGEGLNPMMSEEACRALMDRQKQMRDAFIEAINANLPDGVNVVPLCMLPEQCWNSLHRPFLLRALQLTPYGSWNMTPVPKDEVSAGVLRMNLPRWTPDPHYIEGVVEHVGGFASEVQGVNDDIHRALAAGKPPRLYRLAEIEDEVRRKLRGIAFYIASEMVGGETLTRSRETFYGERYDPAPGEHAPAVEPRGRY